MKCRILHESKGRMRVRVLRAHLDDAAADKLQFYLNGLPFVDRAKVSERSLDATIRYRGERADVIRALSEFDFTETAVAVPDHTGRALQREYEDRFFFLFARRVVKNFLIPLPARNVLTVIKGVRYIAKGAACLVKRKIEVPVLDATSVAVSLLRFDFGTASSLMFLLDVGELLEEWTHKKSVDDLAQHMMLDVEEVWLAGGKEDVLVPIDRVREGDLIRVSVGSMIPLDGIAASGEAEVNQSSMTGESMPVHKEEGNTVYAGTVLEEGELLVRVTQRYGEGRYDRIVRMIEDSEKLKSASESRAAHIADRLVPYSLGGTALTYLLTRNVTKALSILMVDFSCALKLTMPIAVLSAMRECSDRHISVKGGKFLEAAACADTLVFDKTGTLTYANPRVRKVVVFGGNNTKEMLRLAACLEEHFPHSIANAVVTEARRQGLDHEEHHAKVEYVVAHGIASSIGGRRVVIGSHHFIFEDEGCVIPEGEKRRFGHLPSDCSLLYMALDGVLSAVLCIEDPLRPEASEVIDQLHALGITKIVMMTGDSEKTAAAVAAKVGVDEYYSEVLPEDKAAFVKREHTDGRKVLMIGDGVNDSPALSEADAGIAISTGAAIAREIADITIAAEDLGELVKLRKIAMALMRRINGNYRKIMSFNGTLIALGVAGVLQPAASSLLHNASTLAFGLQSMSDLTAEES